MVELLKVSRCRNSEYPEFKYEISRLKWLNLYRFCKECDDKYEIKECFKCYVC